MRALSVGLLMSALLTTAAADGRAQSRVETLPRSRSVALVNEAPVAAQDIVAERAALAQEIVRKKEQSIARGPLDERFVRDWVERLARLPIDRLRDLAVQGDAIDLNAVNGSAADVSTPASLVQADAVAADLGDSGRDFVYTKVAPCRVADTRNVSNPLGSGTSRSFYVAGTDATHFGSQGGSPCGIPLGATSVAVNLTVTGTSGPGWLRAYPYGGFGNASVINYGASDTIANGLILPICDPGSATCTFDLTVVADSYGTHVLIDVMGYFMKPSALGTLRTFSTTSSTPFGSPGLTLPESNNCANYTSITITAPGQGQLQVTAKVLARLTHANGTANEVWWGLSPVASDCTTISTSFGTSSSLLLLDASQPTAQSNTWDTIQWVYDAPAAGSYTSLRQREQGMRVRRRAHRLVFGGMVATFQPR